MKPRKPKAFEFEFGEMKVWSEDGHRLFEILGNTFTEPMFIDSGGVKFAKSMRRWLDQAIKYMEAK